MKGAIILIILLGLSFAGTYLSITKISPGIDNVKVYEGKISEYKKQVGEYNVQGEDKGLEYKEQIIDYENQIALWKDQPKAAQKDIPTMSVALASLVLGIVAGVGLKLAWVKGRKL